MSAAVVDYHARRLAKLLAMAKAEIAAIEECAGVYTRHLTAAERYELRELGGGK